MGPGPVTAGWMSRSELEQTILWVLRAHLTCQSNLLLFIRTAISRHTSHVTSTLVDTPTLPSHITTGFSHILPGSLKDHPRNKSDELIRLVGSKGGFVGLSQFGRHMQKGNDSTIDNYVVAVDYVIGLIGEDLVGIGSDSSEGHGRPSDFMAWCNKDKGYARQLTLWGSQKAVKPLGPLAERAELALAKVRSGWSQEKMRKVLGENWLRHLAKIVGEDE